MNHFLDPSDNILENTELNEALFINSERVRIKAEAKVADRRSICHSTGTSKENLKKCKLRIKT